MIHFAPVLIVAYAVEEQCDFSPAAKGVPREFLRAIRRGSHVVGFRLIWYFSFVHDIYSVNG